MTNPILQNKSHNFEKEKSIPDVEPETDLLEQAQNHQASASWALAHLEVEEEHPQVEVVEAFLEAKEVVEAS
jgi:hypothetical protein